MNAARSMRVGAIDVGSNSIRLLVADVGDSGGAAAPIETVARAGEACRLARGLDRTGRIDPDLAERAATVVSEFAQRARSLGAVNIVLAATAALRAAGNGDEVATLLGRRSGLSLRILTGEEEARLVYQAVVDGLGNMVSRSSCVVFDLGGGSTEVVSGFAGQPGRWVSLPFGAVSLTERFLASDPVRTEEVEHLRDHVRQTLMHACACMPDRAPMLAGVGGTITLLAAMDRGLSAYEPSLIEGHTIPLERLRAWVDRLAELPHSKRVDLPVMGEGRADIVVAGGLVVDEITRRFPCPALVCSTRGLRYALARVAARESTEA